MPPNPDPSSTPSASSLRLLILSPTHTDKTSPSPFRPFLEAFTGSKPSDDVAVFAGYTSHPPLRIQTKYYDQEVGIWCDEVPFPEPDSEGKGKEKEKTPLSGNLEDRGDHDHDSTATPPVSTGPTTTDFDSTSPPTIGDWQSQILSAEAAEVRAVIGGIILLLPIRSSSPTLAESLLPLIQTTHTLREQIEDESSNRDTASLVVLQGTNPSATAAKLNELLESLEDACLGEGILGWDFVAWDGVVDKSDEGGRSEVIQMPNAHAHVDASVDVEEKNEFGEKTGLPRVREVLEGIDWSASPHFDGDDDGEIPFDGPDDFDFSTDDLPRPGGILRHDMSSFSGIDFELQREMLELKMSMLSPDEDDDAEHPDHETYPSGNGGGTAPTAEKEDEEAQIDNLPALMERVVAIREAGAEMAPGERERFAKREIARIMTEIG
jgi:hypothetical protein